MNYKISEKAKEDIEKIWLNNFDKWSVEQADRYYNLIMDEIEYLSMNFESGKSLDRIRNGYRSSRVKSHIIFYRETENRIIEIIRILHQQMDISKRLKE